MNIGDIVSHKQSGRIGRIIKIEETYGWGGEYICLIPLCFCAYHSLSFTSKYTVSFFNVKKKYKKNYYEAHELTPHQLEESASSALSDWLATPSEKLRNALALKNKKNALANQSEKVRLDGRNRNKRWGR